MTSAADTDTADFTERFWAAAGSPEADWSVASAALARQVRHHGLTYTLYGEGSSAQQPWALELFPLSLGRSDWQAISSLALSRADALDRLFREVYAPERVDQIPHWLAEGRLRNGEVFCSGGYQPALQGVLPPPGVACLGLVALDLARTPEGQWGVVAHRCQAPSGLGYALANRMLIARQHLAAFGELSIEPLGSPVARFLDLFQTPEGEAVLLTPGAYNETYFEQVYLARTLGLTLVEGSDLTVRGNRLFVRTVKGLSPVSVMLRRIDDAYLDPLQLRPDSMLGVPGLLQVVRSGHLRLMSLPGSAFLESRAVVQALNAGTAGAMLDSASAAGSLPVWREGGLHERTYQLRVFLMQHPSGWMILPGGLARLSAGPDDQRFSMQQGGSSADVWLERDSDRHALADQPLSVVQQQVEARRLQAGPPALSSRSAENLFWLGRYTERCEHAVRIGLLQLESVAGEVAPSPALSEWLALLGVQQAEVGEPARAMSRCAGLVRDRLSLEQWGQIQRLEALLTSRLGELSPAECWSAAPLSATPGPLPASILMTTDREEQLRMAIGLLAGITGAQADRMLRDEGWQLLTIGRLLERTSAMAFHLESMTRAGLLTPPMLEPLAITMLCQLADAPPSQRARLLVNGHRSAVIEHLVLDDRSPRALGWVVRSLRKRLSKLADTPLGEFDAIGRQLPDLRTLTTEDLWPISADLLGGPSPAGAEVLANWLQGLRLAAWQVSDQLNEAYFSHIVSRTRLSPIGV